MLVVEVRTKPRQKYVVWDVMGSQHRYLVADFKAVAYLVVPSLSGNAFDHINNLFITRSPRLQLALQGPPGTSEATDLPIA